MSAAWWLLLDVLKSLVSILLFSVIIAIIAARFGCGVHGNAVAPASDLFDGN